MLKQEYF